MQPSVANLVGPLSLWLCATCGAALQMHAFSASNSGAAERMQEVIRLEKIQLGASERRAALQHQRGARGTARIAKHRATSVHRNVWDDIVTAFRKTFTGGSPYEWAEQLPTGPFGFNCSNGGNTSTDCPEEAVDAIVDAAEDSDATSEVDAVTTTTAGDGLNEVATTTTFGVAAAGSTTVPGDSTSSTEATTIASTSAGIEVEPDVGASSTTVATSATATVVNTVGTHAPTEPPTTVTVSTTSSAATTSSNETTGRSESGVTPIGGNVSKDITEENATKSGDDTGVGINITIPDNDTSWNTSDGGNGTDYDNMPLGPKDDEKMNWTLGNDTLPDAGWNISKPDVNVSSENIKGDLNITTNITGGLNITTNITGGLNITNITGGLNITNITGGLNITKPTDEINITKPTNEINITNITAGFNVTDIWNITNITNIWNTTGDSNSSINSSNITIPPWLQNLTNASDANATTLGGNATGYGGANVSWNNDTQVVSPENSSSALNATDASALYAEGSRVASGEEAAEETSDGAAPEDSDAAAEEAEADETSDEDGAEAESEEGGGDHSEEEDGEAAEAAPVDPMEEMRRLLQRIKDAGAA